MVMTFVFAFWAAPLAPKLSVKAFSVVFLSSNGLAQRSSGVLFRALTVGPKFAHPAIAFVVIYSVTKADRSSGVILKPDIPRSGYDSRLKISSQTHRSRIPDQTRRHLQEVNEIADI